MLKLEGDEIEADLTFGDKDDGLVCVEMDHFEYLHRHLNRKEAILICQKLIQDFGISHKELLR